MKKYLYIIPVVALICFAAYYYHLHYQLPGEEAEQSSPAVFTNQERVARKIDVDAMAGRMKSHQDIYKRLRDESLKVYAARRPAGRYDEVDAEEIRMAAYLWVWDDFYREGLWQAVAENVKEEISLPPAQSDPLVVCMESINHYRTYFYSDDTNNPATRALVDRVDASDYPVEFKMWAWLHIAHTISRASGYAPSKPLIPKSLAMLPELVKKTSDCYRQLIKEKLPDDLLFTQGDQCLDWVHDNKEALDEMNAELDKDFEAEAPGSPVRTLLQGRYYTLSAWNARGDGYANTVSEEANRLMQERLAKSAAIFEAAYKKYPDNSEVGESMIEVELGQGEGMARMEGWFQAAVHADPDDYEAYRAKAYYLLPRWYGSPALSWQFGLDCVKTGKWGAKIPMILVYAADDFDDTKHGEVFQIPAIWDPLEKVFREWLERYPESTVYRSKFAKYAAMGKHWDIVKEQCALLGNNWDKLVFQNFDYAAMKQRAITETRKP